MTRSAQDAREVGVIMTAVYQIANGVICYFHDDQQLVATSKHCRSRHIVDRVRKLIHISPAIHAVKVSAARSGYVSCR